MEVSGQHQAPAALLPIKNSGTNSIERWVGPGPVWTLVGIRICPTRRYSSTYLITTSRSPAFPSAPARALQRTEFLLHRPTAAIYQKCMQAFTWSGHCFCQRRNRIRKYSPDL